ncbi:guanine nucleotide-binding protein subunit beta [Acrasis kona]|uniref:Guanine nucleotide-binding protein subunit beta n=1 Tax=Acrasis kona TaxID=1008807 RepID=A0AAW2ZEW4_9EUKA
MANTTNNDISKRVQGSTGTIPYTVTSDSKLSLAVDNSNKALCFNPSVSLSGFQTFIAFNYPTLPNAAATGITLVQKSGSFVIKSTLSFPSSGQQNMQLVSDTVSNSLVTLQSNTDYLLVVSVDPDTSFVSNSLIDSRRNVMAESINYLVDGDLISAITDDEFFICVTTNAASRSVHASNSTMVLNYFGSKKGTSLVANSNATTTTAPPRKLSGGQIAGIVIGLIAFCVIVIVSILIFVIIIAAVSQKRKQKVPVQQRNIEMSNFHA